MNKVEKGRRNELEFAKILKENGFVVWKPCKCRRGAGSDITTNDIFGLFDIIAIDETGYIHLIQVKTGYNITKAKKEIKEFIESFSDKMFNCLIANKTNKKWKVIQIYLNIGDDRVVFEKMDLNSFLKAFGGASNENKKV